MLYYRINWKMIMWSTFSNWMNGNEIDINKLKLIPTGTSQFVLQHAVHIWIKWKEFIILHWWSSGTCDIAHLVHWTKWLVDSRWIKCGIFFFSTPFSVIQSLYISQSNSSARDDCVPALLSQYMDISHTFLIIRICHGFCAIHLKTLLLLSYRSIGESIAWNEVNFF